MKKINDLEKIEILEDKIDKLQRSVNKLEKKLSDHIKFIDKVYEPLRNPSLSRISIVSGVTLIKINRLEIFTRRLKLSSLIIISLISKEQTTEHI